MRHIQNAIAFALTWLILVPIFGLVYIIANYWPKWLYGRSD